MSALETVSMPLIHRKRLVSEGHLGHCDLFAWVQGSISPFLCFSLSSFRRFFDALVDVVICLRFFMGNSTAFLILASPCSDDPSPLFPSCDWFLLEWSVIFEIGGFDDWYAVMNTAKFGYGSLAVRICLSLI